MKFSQWRNMWERFPDAPYRSWSLKHVAVWRVLQGRRGRKDDSFTLFKCSPRIPNPKTIRCACSSIRSTLLKAAASRTVIGIASIPLRKPGANAVRSRVMRWGYSCVTDAVFVEDMNLEVGHCSELENQRVANHEIVVSSKGPPSSSELVLHHLWMAFYTAETHSIRPWGWSNSEGNRVLKLVVVISCEPCRHHLNRKDKNEVRGKTS